MFYNHILEMKTIARKEGWPAFKLSILSLIQGEAESIAKRKNDTITDDLIISVCKKIIDNNNDTLKVVENEILKMENEFVSQFIPPQLSNEELKLFIDKEKENCKHIGEMFKKLDEQ
jgi:uncharacterized protein YqeY